MYCSANTEVLLHANLCNTLFEEKRGGKDFSLFLKNMFLIGCREKKNLAALFLFFKAGCTAMFLAGR